MILSMEVINGLTSPDVALHGESPLSCRVGVVTISRCGRVHVSQWCEYSSGISRLNSYIISPFVVQF